MPHDGIFASKGGGRLVDGLKKVFSGSVDASRVNPAGLVLMLAAVLIVALSERIARRLRPQGSQTCASVIKIVALIICALGALLAILG